MACYRYYIEVRRPQRLLVLIQPYTFTAHYENTPIQLYWKFYDQNMKIFR